MNEVAKSKDTLSQSAEGVCYRAETERFSATDRYSLESLVTRADALRHIPPCAASYPRQLNPLRQTRCHAQYTTCHSQLCDSQEEKKKKNIRTDNQVSYLKAHPTLAF